MSSAFEPSGWQSGKMNNVGRRKHFPQVGADGICGKKINPTDRNGGRSGSDLICGQSRDGDRHLHYACRADHLCRVKSWSLEERERHEESH